MCFMRMRYQAQVYNENKQKYVMREAKRKHDEVGEEIHQASTMAGEVIARLNNNKTTKVEDVIKHYNPKYLEREAK